MAKTIGLRAEVGLKLRDRADEILYGWLIDRFRGSGGRSRAAGLMRDFINGNYYQDGRLHDIMLGIRMGLRNDQGD